MSKKVNKKRKNFLVPQDKVQKRKVNTRNENSIKEDASLMLFSFKDFQYNSQIPPGQGYSNWQEKELLAYMLEKFGYICNKTRVEAENSRYIKVYYKIDFPPKSKFKNPFPETKLDWAVIMNIKGQKPRVAGYIIGNIFYVVFLDAEHQFYPSIKRNT